MTPEQSAAYQQAITAMRERATRGERLDADGRQLLFQELESLVAARGFGPEMATRMWDAWGDAEAEVDRLETINQALREALAPFVEAANPLTAELIDDMWTTVLVTCGDVERARAALLAEGSGDDA